MDNDLVFCEPNLAFGSNILLGHQYEFKQLLRRNPNENVLTASDFTEACTPYSYLKVTF